MSANGDTPDCRFQREGEYWTVAYGGSVCRLRDTKGLRYLARLLAQPGASLPVGDLDAPAADDRTRTREHIRLAVCRCLNSALTRIAAAHPELGRHLETTIRRGYACSYSPDPRVPIRWET